MKSLLILRHGQAGRKDDPSVPDHDRPLTDKGEKDAEKVGCLIRADNLRPDKILTSTAKRAADTARGAADAAGIPTDKIQRSSTLYDSDENAYLTALRGLPDSCQRAMIVGHRPALDKLLVALAHSMRNIPKAGLVLLELDINSWKNLTPGRGHVVKRWLSGDLPDPNKGANNG